MTALILSLAILLLLGTLTIVIRFIRSVKNQTPWLIFCLTLILLIGLNVVLIVQDISPGTSYRPNLIVAIISLGIAAFMFAGLYYISTDLTPLMRSEEQLQTLFDNYPGYLLLKDDQYNYRVVNSAFATFLGKEVDAIIGKTDFDFFPRSQALIFQLEDEQTLLSGNPSTNEHEVRGVDGKIWLEITRTPYTDENIAASALMITAQDITARKVAEISKIKQNRDLITIQDASLALMENLDLSFTIDTVLSWSKKLSGLPDGFVCLVEPDGSSIRFRAVSEQLEKFLLESVKPGEGFVGRAWQTGQPLFVDNYNEWNGRTKHFSDLDIGAVACFPLMNNTKVCGVLGFLSDQSGQIFNEDTVEVLSRYCEIASLAIVDSQTFTDCQIALTHNEDNIATLNHQRRLERLVTRLATHFVNLPREEIDHGIEQTLQTISRYTGIDRCYLFLFQSESADPGVVYEWRSEGTSPIPKELIELFGDGFDWGLQQLNNIETIHISDTDDLPAEAGELADYLTSNGIHSFTAVPLESRRSVLGFLGFDSINKEKEWSSDEIELLKITADLLVRSVQLKNTALSLEEARSEDHVKMIALEQRNRESTLITEMAELLQACRTADEAYPIIARYIRQLITDLSGALYMLRSRDDPADKVVSWGEDRFDINEDELLVNECWALRRGRLHLVTDPGIGPLCKHLTEPIPSAYLCIPLIAQGEAVGLLHLRSEPQHELSDEQIATNQHLAVMMAEHIALALSNLSLRDELRSQAIRDPLTNLFNRRYMEETLVRELRRGARHGTPVGFIMFDIDQLKPVNDNLGHDAGDVLLKSVGGLLLKLFRGEDVACRYGGDEFTIILPEASLPDVWRRAEELREAVKILQLEYEGKPLRPCSLSVGVAAFPDHGTTIETLIKASDAAIYAAKAEGGDRIMLGQSEEPV
jgi:diguanylate cyclase (GGDEF)-like protein/PAS domain S-box-containing protein